MAVTRQFQNRPQSTQPNQPSRQHQHRLLSQLLNRPQSLRLSLPCQSQRIRHNSQKYRHQQSPLHVLQYSLESRLEHSSSPELDLHAAGQCATEVQAAAVLRAGGTLVVHRAGGPTSLTLATILIRVLFFLNSRLGRRHSISEQSPRSDGQRKSCMNSSSGTPEESGDRVRPWTLRSRSRAIPPEPQTSVTGDSSVHSWTRTSFRHSFRHSALAKTFTGIILLALGQPMTAREIQCTC